MGAIVAPSPDISVREGRNLKTKPWGHQCNAIDFLRDAPWTFRAPIDRFHPDYPGWKRSAVPEGGAGYLAMWMGTGKTLVGVSMACNLAIDTCLIAAPKRVVPVWPQQFQLHADRNDLLILALGDHRPIKQKTSQADLTLKLARAAKKRFIVVVNYEMLWRPPFNEWALDQTWGLTIFDEIHRIKQASGRQSMFAAHLRDRSVYRLGLSGTPLPHSPLDAYAQYRFLEPSIYGTSNAAFKARYAVYGGFQNKQVLRFVNLPDFEERMGRIMFRVGKDVLDLPEEVKITRECDLAPTAARIYGDMEREFVAQVKDGLVTAANAMTKLIRLQQITSGFVKLESGEEQPIDDANAKGELLLEHFEDIEPGEPVVVFCRYKHDLRLVHGLAKAAGRSSLELSGDRDELALWQAGGANVLAVQIQAGGLGVDLTRARYAIYYSIGFNLGEYEQALARVHRPGQSQTTFQIHLAVGNSIDTRVMKALEKRQDLVQSILDAIRSESPNA